MFVTTFTQPNIEIKYLWVCDKCDDKQFASMGDISIAGTPFCGECGDDMFIVESGFEITTTSEEN